MFRRVSSWDQQPQDWAELSELARQLGASDLLLPAGPTLAPVNSLLAANGTNGTLAAAVNQQGRGVQFTSGGAYFLDRGANDPRNGYWWMIVGSISAVGTWSGLFSRTSDNSTTNGLAWQRFSSTDALYVFHGPSGQVNAGVFNSQLSSEPAVWIGTWEKATGQARLYKNGVQVCVGTISTEPAFTAGQGQFKVFSSRDTALTSGAVNMAAFGTVTPTASQVADLSANAWALLQRRDWVFSSVASGGGGGNVTVSISGVSATVQAGTVVPALAISVTGLGSTSAVGSVTRSQSVGITGIQSAAQAGTVTTTGGVEQVKSKGLRKTRYTPGRVPSDAKELARFIQNELERLTDALESPFTHQLLEVLHAEPSRKSGEAAMVAYADGTDWNPGAGRGLYLYDPQTAAWTKL